MSLTVLVPYRRAHFTAHCWNRGWGITHHLWPRSPWLRQWYFIVDLVARDLFVPDAQDRFRACHASKSNVAAQTKLGWSRHHCGLWPFWLICRIVSNSLCVRSFIELLVD